MNNTTMLGTYTLDGNVPVEPEIVLSNCHDTAMLGQLVSMFEGSPDIRFFLIHEVDESAIDLAADFFFLKDNGNWVLANDNTMLDVLFDDASFTTGSEETFSLIHMDDGSYSIATDAVHAGYTDLPSSDHLLVDMTEDGLFVDVDTAHADTDSDSFFIDPSVLSEGQSEIVLSNFIFGSDHLELPDGMSIKDVVVNNDHDFTEVIIGQNDHMGEDIVVKLLGISQPDMPTHDLAIDAENTADDLINHLIHSGRNVD
ncbi:hypothetical protein [Pseudodesulfovibrio sp. S3]|uniref:hypothetical protein n=2 Tax=unclassified Pseudodesulfovibrio TaxID=2661612 RepID=UPI0013E351BE|nr:hypothetical protein [Pseudodesulfovibrio sp. S3]MCJ2163464.1 hypothetical protein [Pseudodesulfovibrio sp. S3-i]